MNIISVEVTYPTLPQPPLTIPPRYSIATPIARPQSLASYQEESQQGVVGYYDINELREKLKLFGISNGIRTVLPRRRKTAVRRDISTQRTSILTCDAQYANKSISPMSREHSRKLFPIHSAATRSCYIDFSGNFRDAVRAQTIKIVTKDSAPAVNPNVSQQIKPKTPQVPKRKKHVRRKKKRHSTSEPVQIKEGLLVVSNGQVVDYRKDVRRSKNLTEDERKRLRNDMCEHSRTVRSFHDIITEYDVTKMQLEQIKKM